MEIRAKSALETKKIGQRIGRILKGGETICLYGPLGSGKTTFAQGIAERFKINRLPSPTFIIVRRYPARGRAIKNFYHVDLYRIEKEEELKSLGLKDFFSPENVVVIEWAEKGQNLLPEERIDICFEYISEKERKITIFSDIACRELKKPSKS